MLSLSLTADPLGAGDHTRTLEHDGHTRTYIVHVPPKYDPKQPTPVVLAFHGGGSNGVRFLGKSTQNISANDLMWEFFQKHPMN